MLLLPAAGFAAALLVQPTVADVISEPPPWEYAEPYWAASDAAASLALAWATVAMMAARIIVGLKEPPVVDDPAPTAVTVDQDIADAREAEEKRVVLDQRARVAFNIREYDHHYTRPQHTEEEICA